MAQVDYDTSLTVSATLTASQDTSVTVGVSGSVSHDTMTIVDPRLTMIYDNQVVAFSRGSRRPVRTVTAVQARAESSGAVPFGFDSQDVDDLINLNFEGMSEADYESLKDFFFNTVEGMAKTFVWADVNGDVHTVRFADSLLQAEEKAHGRFNLFISLRVLG